MDKNNDHKLKAYLQFNKVRSDGTKDSFRTERVEIKIKELEWQKQNLSYTASGYGSKIPMRYMVKYCNKWRRVYCMCYGNSGTPYITIDGQDVTVDIYS